MNNPANNTLSNMIANTIKNNRKIVNEKEANGDYEVVMTFKLTKGQKAQIDKWLAEEIYPEVIEQQKRDFEDTAYISAARMCWEDGYPYAGAIGGGVSYCFSPTGLGDVLVVQNAWNDKTLNVTDFETW